MSEQHLLMNVPVNEIYVDPKWNKRGEFAPIECVELAQNIAEHGLNQPVNVVPHTIPDKPDIKYRLIAGFRRWTACVRINKQTTINCLLITGLSHIKEVSWNIRENVQRKQLNIGQEARALQEFVDEGYDAKAIAVELGQATGWVQTRLDVLKYPLDIQELISAGLMTQEQIRAGARFSRDKQYALIKAIRDARIQGDRITVVVPKKNHHSNKRKVPGVQQINGLIDFIYTKMGSDGITFASRCLSLAAGNISWDEFWPDLGEFMATVTPGITPGMTAEEFLESLESKSVFK